MIHLECLGCKGHPICREKIDKMSIVEMTRNVEEASCIICKRMIGLDE